MKSTKTARTILLVMALTTFCMPLLLAMTGCSSAEEKAPSGYYTGPLKPKDNAVGSQKGMPKPD